MRANLDIENRNILTKKFWSYLKSTTKSTRIPEVVSCGTIVASEPIAKAKMFSERFLKQFSEPSTYQIELDLKHDTNVKIDFSVSRIKSILDALDTNKANGPDGISGTVLKHCSDSLSYPLSKIFHLCYIVGYIPPEWKTSNIVPVHKKDEKRNVENYRPISLISLVMKVFEHIVRRTTKSYGVQNRPAPTWFLKT